MQQIVQLFLFSLCYADLYIKISVDLVLEGIEFVLQLNRFLLLRVNKDILDWSQLISHEFTQIKTRGHVHFQFLSHLQMKLTTSSIISGNSLIVQHS